VGSARLPDFGDVEYWAGTESSLRSAPLNVSPMGTVALSTTGPAAAAAPARQAPARSNVSPSPRSGAPAGAPAAAGPVSLEWHGPAQVKPGETVTLALNVKSVQPLNRLDLVVSFNPEAFKALDVMEGGFLRQENTPFVLHKNIDQASGQVQLDIQGSGPDGASGAGTLVTLVFEALAPNPNSQFVVGRMAPSGPGGETLTATTPDPYSIKVLP